VLVSPCSVTVRCRGSQYLPALLRGRFAVRWPDQDDHLRGLRGAVPDID
jgi:hypothetical protein